MSLSFLSPSLPLFFPPSLPPSSPFPPIYLSFFLSIYLSIHPPTLSMDSVDSYFIQWVKSITAIIHFDAQIVSDLARGKPFQTGSCVVLTCPYYVLSTLSLSGTRYSRLILYFPCPSPGTSHFSKEPGFSGE